MKIKPWIIFLIGIPVILGIFRELKTPITSSTPAAITSTSKPNMQFYGYKVW